MAKTITLTTPGAKAHYGKTNLDNNFSGLNLNFANFLHLSGTGEASNTMLGTLDMGSQRIANVASPAASFDVATKAYVDQALVLGSTIGTIGSLVADADADTYVKTEVTADEDIVHIGSVGADKLRISTSGTLVLDELSLDTDVLLQNSAGTNSIELSDSTEALSVLFRADSVRRLELDGTNDLAIFADNIVFSAINKGLQDLDGDTRIILEETSDVDTIKLIAGGITQLTINASDVTFGTAASLNTLVNVGVGTTTHASGADNCITITESTFPGAVGANTIVLGAVDVGGTDTAIRLKTQLGSLITLGQISIFDDVTISDDLTVTDDVSVGGDIAITGGLTLGGDITLTGGATITGAIALTGDLTITGALSATGNITLGDATSDTIEANGTINLDKIGTVGAAGWPCFSAYTNVNQTISTTNATEIAANYTEKFDTNSNFDTATGRFTPTVPGKYFVTLRFLVSGATAGEEGSVWISKNSADQTNATGEIRLQHWMQLPTTTTTKTGTITGLFDMNGSTDYLSVWSKSTADTSYNFASLSIFEASRIA